jgi:hypothetical protein
MLIENKGKIKPITHVNNKTWVKELKGYFGENVQMIYEYLYFVYSKNSYVKHLSTTERKEYVFKEHCNIEGFSNWQSLEQDSVMVAAIDLYLKTMRTENERTLYEYECRVDELNRSLMSIEDVSEVKEKLQVIELFEKQMDKLKIKIIEDDADNIKPIGITMFEIPDDKIQLL